MNPYKEQQRNWRKESLEYQVKERLKAHDRVGAVRLYREQTRCDLKAAMREIDRLTMQITGEPRDQ